MTSFDSEAVTLIDKFNGENFNLWKSKIRMLLASMDIWNIVDISEKTRPSDVDPKMLKKIPKTHKKVMFITDLNLTNNQLAHIMSCT